MKILFKHGHLVIDGNKEYLDGALLVEDETIVDVFVDSNSIKKDLSEVTTIDLGGKIIMPGFFDSHTHGNSGVDFSCASKDDLDKASYEYMKNGTTSFLTSLTNSKNIKEELNIIENYEDKHSRLLGVHFEGPFINKDTLGMLNPNNVNKPDLSVLDELLNSSSKIRQMTVAPELENSDLIINKLNQNNINVMVGHSNALYENLKDKNYHGFTHLFNRCTPLHHRKIGAVNIAFSDETKYSELICDGIHVDLNVLKLTLKNIRRDRLVMISDSVLLAGLPDGKCEFEGEECHKKGLEVTRVKDNVIAGGACFMIDGVKNMYKLGASLTDILLMTSLNAYRLYKLDQRFGSLVKGKYADIVILDEELNVVNVYCKGKLLYD